MFSILIPYNSQVYPYFYIRHNGPPEEINEYCKSLAENIDSQIQSKVSAKYAKNRAVAAIIPVKGIPFYGFHPGYELFLKVYIFNPILIGTIVNLIETGVVCEKQKVFESHIPYLLQFLVDYNLYGMDYINLSFVKFRGALKEEGASDWDDSLGIHKTSHCKLEMDTWPNEILNRYRVKERPNIAPMDLSKVIIPETTKLIPSLANIWDDENQRRIDRGMDVINSTGSFSVDVGKVPVNEWPCSEALLKRFEAVLQAIPENPTVDCRSFGQDKYPNIVTAFEAVSALHPPLFISKENNQSQVSDSSIQFIDTNYITSQKSQSFQELSRESFDGFISPQVYQYRNC
jgi:hypothetical protein